MDKHSICVKRFIDGVSWEHADAYKLMRDLVKKKPGTDGCYSEADIVQRYSELDQLFKVVLTEKRLKQKKQISYNNFRESGGIYVHIGRNGEILFGSGGCHRLAISQIIGLRLIPAQLGVVHKDYVKRWKSPSSNIQLNEY